MTSDTRSEIELQLVRLASDNVGIYQDARRWFLAQGPSISSALTGALQDKHLGSVGHWRILLLIRDFAVPSTLPAIHNSLQIALKQKDPIVMPGALEALAVFPPEQVIPAFDSVIQFGEVDDVVHVAALLGGMGGELAVKSLSALLSHQYPGVRKTAVRSLLKIGTAQAIEILKRHKQQETDPDVRSVMNSLPG